MLALALLLTACTASTSTDASEQSTAPVTTTSQPETSAKANLPPETTPLPSETSPIPLGKPRWVPFVFQGRDLGIQLDYSGKTTWNDVIGALDKAEIPYTYSSTRVETKAEGGYWILYFTEDKLLYQIFIFDQSYVTPEGFQVNSTVGKMKEIYGTGYDLVLSSPLEDVNNYCYDGLVCRAFIEDRGRKGDDALVYMIAYGAILQRFFPW
ncbi:MAG: hypothetical protein LBJ11_08420 [Oscillospiraceae bacterium]|nr:hypothetical protein [Oscillospiraceae bacterium]